MPPPPCSVTPALTLPLPGHLRVPSGPRMRPALSRPRLLYWLSLLPELFLVWQASLQTAGENVTFPECSLQSASDLTQSPMIRSRWPLSSGLPHFLVFCHTSRSLSLPRRFHIGRGCPARGGHPVNSKELGVEALVFKYFLPALLCRSLAEFSDLYSDGAGVPVSVSPASKIRNRDL